ncbi:UNVERIFIED_CONTAM: Calcium/calmodulin-regulated receptor-like kinase [Sesamum calycinum]|uniref:Dihydroflavonol 4-reductase n=1 Tax=Sesamum calycinum TaxID=2727403 RepID=A0AAW2Q4R3_9LAMI
MREESSGLIVGISIGVVIGVALAVAAFFCVRYHRKRSQIGNSSSRRAATIPIRANGADSCSVLSDSSIGTESPKSTLQNGISFWLSGLRKANVIPASGILEYSYKDLQKATCNFTTLIGQGAYGPVYKAQMSTGETVAVKMLASDSKQGEKEFQTEVTLLGRLHHRNLVNLVGYCAEKNQHMLIYVYMSRGSLASHLYSEKFEPLNWELRVQIALDVARGLEYLHDGAVPPVIHRDIKSSNILLDQSMRARVADFGLSREEMVSKHASHIRGTFGYLDPEYISTRSFTKKSDVYSYGVLLFELIAGRNPLQGLMEHVELAAMNTEGKVGWEEIGDPRLKGNFDVEELNQVAALAHKCVSPIPRRRPSMRDIVQVLSRSRKYRHSRKRDMEDLTPRAHEKQSLWSNSKCSTGYNDFRLNWGKPDRKTNYGPLNGVTVVNLGAVNPIDKEGEEGAGNSGNGGSPELLCSKDRLRLFRADLLEDGSFDEAVIGCDGVFHVAASMEFGVPAVEDLESYVKTEVINPAIRGTLNILKACSRSNTARRIVFTSSISTLTAKNSSGGWIPIVDEACQTHVHHVLKTKASGWVYALSKLLTEEAAFEYAEENGIDLISVITTTVGGPFLTPTVPSSIQVLVSPITGDPKMLPILDSVNSRMGSIALVHIEDICNAHVFLMEHPKAEGRYICCTQSCVMSELVELLRKEYPYCTEAYQHGTGFNPR